MEVRLSSLLAEDEEKLYHELQADALIDRNRRQSVERVSATLDHLLLKYNAACTGDPFRQTAADGEMAACRDMVGLLSACTAKKEIEKRRFRPGGVICLLLSVICVLVALLLIRSYFIPGCVAICAAALCGYMSGRLWYGERDVRVYTELDPDAVLRTLKRTAATADRKIDELVEQQQALSRECGASVQTGDAPDPEALKLYGDLLEGLCSGSGDYALRQLKKLPPWLRRQGIEPLDYTPDQREYFELLPTKRESATQRPALLRDGRLLTAGRATVHTE